MNNSKLLSNLKIVESKLKMASIWNGDKTAVNAFKNPYVFELLCLLQLCVHIEETKKLNIVKRNKDGMDLVILPKSPANKSNFSYIEVINPDGNIHECDLNPGINITDRDKKDRAPDISITAATGDSTPTFNDVMEIWDAKYSENDSRLNDKEVSDFIYTAQQLGFPRPPSALAKILSAKEFNRSGIITNAKRSTEPDSALSRHQLQEVSEFPTSTSTRP
ncbi:hypothetical protein RVV79_006391 [Burkholderia contaminans]|nr:hypothetical protein [Burkholderia contaminans]